MSEISGRSAPSRRFRPRGRTRRQSHIRFVAEGYGAQVTAEVPDSAILEELSAYLAPEIRLRRGHSGACDLRLVRARGPAGAWRIIKNGRRIGPYPDWETTLWALANGIHFGIGHRSPMTFVHAGAVDLDGAALLLPGRSRWGKSTVTAALVERGCGYLSDEYAVLSPEGRVLPFTKPMRLRVTDGAEHRHVVGAGSAEGLRCAAVVLTRYRGAAEWEPSKITAGKAALGLVRHTLCAKERPAQVLRATTRTAEVGQGFEGPRGDAEATADALLRILWHKPTRGQA